MATTQIESVTCYKTEDNAIFLDLSAAEARKAQLNFASWYEKNVFYAMSRELSLDELTDFLLKNKKEILTYLQKQE